MITVQLPPGAAQPLVGAPASVHPSCGMVPEWPRAGPWASRISQAPCPLPRARCPAHAPDALPRAAQTPRLLMWSSRGWRDGRWAHEV